MKTVGIISGIGPESIVLYYQIINRGTNRRLDGSHGVEILPDDVDFEEIARLQKSGDWTTTRNVLAQSVRKLEVGGADFLLFAANAMHETAPATKQMAGVPLLYAVDTTTVAIKRQGLSTVGLLDIHFTMSDGFYTEHMGSQGVQTIAPTATEQDETHRIVFDELCLSRIRPEPARYFYDVTGRLKDEGAQGVILGCTEVRLLVNETGSLLPALDSTAIHALSAVDMTLAE